MDGDEVFALILSILIAAHGLYRWQRAFRSFLQARTAGFLQLLLLVTAPVLLLLLLFALQKTAAKDVRDDPQYQLLFTLAGGAWMNIAAMLMLCVGVDLTGDAIHRKNNSSAIAGIGALIGVVVSFAGANVGEGATIWTTFFPAAISLTAIFVIAGAVQWVSDITYAIAIDRDDASGVRFAGLLVACGIIFARAGAGDWVSAEATLRDYFALGWPVLPIAIVIAGAQRLFRPRLGRPASNLLLQAVAPTLGINIFATLWWIRGLK